MALEQTPANVARDASKHVDLPEAAPMLLGTFGTMSARSALIRLPGGDVQTVAQGDRIGTRQVLAVEDGAVLVAVAGDAMRLTMPGGELSSFPVPREPGSSAPPIRPGHMRTQSPPVRPARLAPGTTRI